ncbi:hypothetical protein ACOTJF_14410 [Achromobacter ruhlandii]|uniref:hypothetical protein n=1 Tax=Achromobacter ruhlandii TaxID=72557 RepID=UPI003BA338F3
MRRAAAAAGGPARRGHGADAEVLESHLRETFLQSAQGARPGAALEPEAEIDQVMRIVRSYLK